MLKDNLIMLRNLHNLSQEEVADQIGISRQAYSKWESGTTIPDIEKCMKLAKLYDVSLDDLVNFQTHQEGMIIPPAPKGKHIFGSVNVNDKGQILIPKQARDIFNINPGDRIIILGDEDQGIALIKAEVFENQLKQILK